MDRGTRNPQGLYLAACCGLFLGCAHQREAVAPRSSVAVRDSAVSVQAPFVNVRVGARPKDHAERDHDDDRDDELDDEELADSTD